MGDRINQADRRSDALSARVDARFGAIDRRFDAVDTRFDLLEARLDDWRNEAAQVTQERRAAGARLALTALVVGALFNLALVVGLYAALDS